MLHLYDFIGVTGPQKILTFVIGPLHKLSSPALSLSPSTLRFSVLYFDQHLIHRFSNAVGICWTPLHLQLKPLSTTPGKT